MRIESIWDFNKVKEKGRKSLLPRTPKISISSSTCGHALGCNDLIKEAQKAKKKGAVIQIGEVGCSGFCNMEPMAVVRLPKHPPIVYPGMNLSLLRSLIRHVAKKTFYPKGVLGKVLALNGDFNYKYDSDEIPSMLDVAPFKGQSRQVLANCGIIDPLSVPEYLAVGGYQALYKALYQMTPEEVLEEVATSGIRGRGGAWFPTATKWELARKARGQQKFVVCNADEGDPGAYKDRTVMEGNPFKLFEGMCLAGYAMGANQGIIYLREEYPYTYRFLLKAIEMARRYGLLGRNVLGSDFHFTIRIIRGGGSYVCGEETALLDSLEGEVGDPRLRPPFPIERGLWDQPTVVNNVETLANIPWIVENGGEQYSRIGTDRAKGTKIFSVIGRIRHPGLYEVPLGTRLDTLIYELAGGPPEGSTIKAVQVGSPFGNFIPPDKIGISLDPETLRDMGSMIGSGVIVVLDQTTCLVDTLRHILSFFVDESCGKCVPCRDGVFRMKEIMDDIYEGRAKLRDLVTLSELAEMISQFALCGLGGGAPGLIMNGIRDFKKDFRAHITTGKCPWPEQ